MDNYISSIDIQFIQNYNFNTVNIEDYLKILYYKLILFKI